LPFQNTPSNTKRLESLRSTDLAPPPLVSSSSQLWVAQIHVSCIAKRIVEALSRKVCWYA